MCINSLSTEVDVSNREELLKIIKSSIGTKFVKKWYVLHLVVEAACV